MKKSYSISQEEFKQSLNKYFLGKSLYFTDDLVAVVTAHLLVEVLVDQCLINQLGFKKTKVFEGADFTVGLKLQLIEAATLIPNELLAAVRKLNKIRNDFAHNLGQTLADADLDLLISFAEQNAEIKKGLRKLDKKQIFGCVAAYVLGRLEGYAYPNK